MYFKRGDTSMELINLNTGDDVNIGKLPYGTTRDIPIKLGNKLYLLDVQKQTIGACIDFYRRVKADRRKYSKYDREAEFVTVFVKPDAVLFRNFFGNIKEISKAQEIYRAYKYLLEE